MLRNNTVSRADLGNDRNRILDIHYGDVLIRYGAVVDVSTLEGPSISITDNRFLGDRLTDGDIIMADTAEDTNAGKCVEIEGLMQRNVVAGLHTIPLRPVTLSGRGYWGQYLNSASFRDQLFPKMQGTKVVSLSRTTVVNATVRYPSLPEQHCIGEFFTTLDSLIAAAERQEDLLKQKKQAYLQLMFPQEGETEPRLRFAGFSGEWQQKMVGDLVGKTFGGGTPSTSNSEYWIGRLPWIQSSNLADGQIFRVDVEKHISDIALQHSSAQLIPAGSIAVVTHVGVGKLALVPFEYSTSQDFISLGDLKCDSRFLSLALQERLRKDLRVVQGSTIKGITKQDLLHKKLTLPKQRDEQARIATFLMLFGKTIAQINERKALLQRMKEAYLQRLFL